ncbi:putative Phytocyanin domain, cupredoxin [Helianthus annuus]|uniref:Phytocyanin domain, cupredoxin n=1 Tax=Helianthus annuus TaxID=4232 RepID=A0A251UUN2_HELAN|nr:stellacyanin [Helianthus annuus]KAF5770523.1 putative Phytocyanin domain, cupredoxin [Helianthus annuus]
MAADGGHWFSILATIIVPLATVIILFTPACSGTITHTVGDSIWSIPQTEGFYNKWASSRLFRPGDILYFEFDRDLYHVMRVQNWEYQMCETNIVIPWEVYRDGKAWVTLPEEGYYTYICNVLDYCSLGLRFELKVNKSDSP